MTRSFITICCEKRLIEKNCVNLNGPTGLLG